LEIAAATEEATRMLRAGLLRGRHVVSGIDLLLKVQTVGFESFEEHSGGVSLLAMTLAGAIEGREATLRTL